MLECWFFVREKSMYKRGFFGNRKKRGEWEEGRKYVWKRERERE